MSEDKIIKGIDYTGICVVFYVYDGNGKFFFTKRSEQCRDERGTWECGGGELKFAEHPDDGLARELREELSVKDFKILEKLPSESYIRNEDGVQTHWLTMPYIIQVNPNDVKIGEPHMVDDYGWFSLEELPKPSMQAMLEEISDNKKYFDKYK